MKKGAELKRNRAYWLHINDSTRNAISAEQDITESQFSRNHLEEQIRRILSISFSWRSHDDQLDAEECDP